MIIVNFGHPLTEPQVSQIAAKVNMEPARIIEAMPHVDMDEPFEPQMVNFMASIDVTPRQWQTEAILIGLPGLATFAACLLAELHGRMGHFPSFFRLARNDDGVFEVVEVIRLQNIRDDARAKRLQ